MKLDSYQKKVVKKDLPLGTALRVVANAGAGKSTTMLHKANYLATVGGEKISSIVMVSFSRKSREDLESKWKKTFGTNQPQIATLHSFGLQLLRKYLKVNVTLIKPYEQQRLLKTILQENCVTPQNLKAELFKLINIISFYKAKNIDRDKILKIPYPKELKVEMDKSTLKRVIFSYIDYLDKEYLFDFDDLIYKTFRLLKDNPDALARVRKKYKTYIVDEAQDLNEMNWQLIFLLCSNLRLIAVGDPCQNIYMFRYAEPEKFSLEEFLKHFQDAIELQLPNNYRSEPDIVSFGNIIRKHCEDPLVAIPQKESTVSKSVFFYRTKHSPAEGQQVVKVVQAFLKLGYKLSDIVIISRSSNFLKTIIEKEVIKENWEYEILAGNAVSLHESSSAMIIMAMVSLICNPKNYVAYTSIVPYMHGMGGLVKQRGGFEKMGKNAELYTTKILTGKSAYIKTKNPKRDATVVQFYNLIIDCSSKIKDIKELGETLDFLYSKHSEYITESFKIKEVQYKRVRSLILHYVTDYLEANPKVKIKQALTDLILNIEGYEPEKKGNRLTLATVHSQKGLESKITIACGFRSYGSLEDLGDEKNILYVQMSRAIERLVIVRSDRYRKSMGDTMEGVENTHFRAVMEKQFPKEFVQIALEEKETSKKSKGSLPPLPKDYKPMQPAETSAY